MAMIKCKECGKDISNQATSCPHCGVPVKKPARTFGCGTAIILATVVAIPLVMFMGSPGPVVHRPSAPKPTVTACVEKGIAYFKEMGSYPTLQAAPNKGRNAEDVARERCQRTPTAFGPLDAPK